MEHEPFHYRLKGAIIDLVDLSGGQERAGRVCGYGKTTVQRWTDREKPDIPPIMAIVALERESGKAYVTEVLASVTGRRLTDPEAASDTGVDLLVAHAHVQVSQASLALAVAEAVADNHVSSTEAMQIDREAAGLDRATDALRSKIAFIRSRHGEGSGITLGGDTP